MRVRTCLEGVSLRVGGLKRCLGSSCADWDMLKEGRVPVQRPAGGGRCCFYCKFVCFKIILLRSVNDSNIYQLSKLPDIYSFFELQAVLECFADSSIDLEVSMRVRGKKNC